MADKELTVFVVEAGSHLSPNAYNYMFDCLAGKLLKGLKTDYVSVVVFNSLVTNHALEDSGKFRGLNVLVDFETPSYDQLKSIKNALSDEEGQDLDACDAFQSLIFSVSLFEKTKKKIFTRNIVLITARDSPLSSYKPELAGAVSGLIKDLNVNLVVIGDNFGSVSDTEQKWFHIASQFASNHIFNTEEASRVAQLCPPVRKTRPMPIYRGELRLGADITKVLRDSSYIAEQDMLCLTFRVEVYPAAKAEILSQNGHEYLVDGNNAVRVERKTNHFIWKRNFQGERDKHLESDEIDEKKFDKVDVDGHTFTPGFKFSNFDLIALDEDLMGAAKLELSSEFDILGFVDVDDIPHAYLTDESFFVVPEKASSLRNLLNHAAFAQSLYEKNLAPLARFVRKQAKEVEVGPMFPVKVKNGDSFCFCYIFIRFPFKEDEKIGKFPSLTRNPPAKAEYESTEVPDAASIDRLMEDFIESKTYWEADEDDTKDISVIDNCKVVLKGSDSSKLSLPSKASGSNKFLCSSPSANKFAVYLRKLLIKSLLVDDYDKFVNDPEFIQHNIREGDDSFTNLFNLENIATVNSSSNPDWLSKIAQASTSSGKRLYKQLGLEYVRKADLKKQKTKKDATILQSKGNYGADEGEYDAVPDFDF
ncbi:CIC11C00000001930 [Sungouiella intermedia]|uniref:DNA helicase n=1 Tax=Sungouiella intermedia TaxID=45354 RepID=A0A1L0CX79_9ASCO|nr:CIC11C00000001930 [[Candida] intermedia]